MANRGHRTVPWVNDGCLIKWPKLGMDGIGKKVEIPSRIGDVGSTHGTSEQGVSNKDMVRSIIDRKKQRTTTQGVTGSMKHTMLQSVEPRRANMSETSGTLRAKTKPTVVIASPSPHHTKRSRAHSERSRRIPGEVGSRCPLDRRAGGGVASGENRCVWSVSQKPCLQEARGHRSDARVLGGVARSCGAVLSTGARELDLELELSSISSSQEREGAV